MLAPFLLANSARWASNFARFRTQVTGDDLDNVKGLAEGGCSTAPLILFSIISEGIEGLNSLKAWMPTWPEQCDGIPISGCSSKTETVAPLRVAASPAVAPLTPHPTTATSTDVGGNFLFLIRD